MVVVAQGFGDAQASFAIPGQEFQKVFPLDKICLAGIERFSSDLVRLPRYRRAEPQNLAGLRYLRYQSLAVARAGRKLGPPGADYENTARGLAFDKKHRSLRIGSRVFDGFELLQYVVRE